MEKHSRKISYPTWIERVVDWDRAIESPERRMALAHALALENVRNGGGPFAALVTTPVGRLISVGTNRVIADCDSTAHAEVQAIRHAEREIGTHDLGAGEDRMLELYASCSPCIQCFGAIWWSGIKKVYSSTGKKEAEAVGFSEGPVDAALWEVMRRERGVIHTADFACGPAALRPFAEFKKMGVLY